MLMIKDSDPLLMLSSLVCTLAPQPNVYRRPGEARFFPDSHEIVEKIKNMAALCGLKNALTVIEHHNKSSGQFVVIVRNSTQCLNECGCQWLAVSAPNYEKYGNDIIFEFAEDGHAFLIFSVKETANALYTELSERFEKYSNTSVLLRQNSFDTWRVTFDLIT
ncbi:MULTISPECIES: hypothetical protein [Vibrio]|nr:MULTISPECIES: hypothetical protein [Vibrio]